MPGHPLGLCGQAGVIDRSRVRVWPLESLTLGSGTPLELLHCGNGAAGPGVWTLRGSSTMLALIASLLTGVGSKDGQYQCAGPERTTARGPQEGGQQAGYQHQSVGAESLDQSAGRSECRRHRGPCGLGCHLDAGGSRRFYRSNRATGTGGSRAVGLIDAIDRPRYQHLCGLQARLATGRNWADFWITAW